jgi:hypothetical protein
MASIYVGASSTRNHLADQVPDVARLATFFVPLARLSNKFA